jgi:hypothetical protein
MWHIRGAKSGTESCTSSSFLLLPLPSPFHHCFILISCRLLSSILFLTRRHVFRPSVCNAESLNSSMQFLSTSSLLSKFKLLLSGKPFLDCNIVGRDSSVGIAIRYGLDGPGIEFPCGRDFPHPSRQVMGPIQPRVQWVPGVFPGDKAATTWSWPPTSIFRQGVSSYMPLQHGQTYISVCGEGPRSRCYGRTAAMRLIVQPCDEDD